MKTFSNGLATGLILQLAVGPVFFFIMNLVLQHSVFDGLAGVFAVTLVDYLYITLAIVGIGKLLEKSKIKKVFGIVSSLALIAFGIVILKNVANGISSSVSIGSTTLLSSFSSVFILTILSPMTIVFFTSIFAAKALEYNYTRKNLYLFGLGTGFATFLFMGASVILFSLVKETVPLLIIQTLNLIVGCLLIGYGAVRILKVLKQPRT